MEVTLTAVPTVMFWLPGEVIVGAALTVQVKGLLVAVEPAASRIVTVELVVPVAVGEPVIVPVAGFMVSPAGVLFRM